MNTYITSTYLDTECDPQVVITVRNDGETDEQLLARHATALADKVEDNPIKNP